MVSLQLQGFLLGFAVAEVSQGSCSTPGWAPASSYKLESPLRKVSLPVGEHTSHSSQLPSVSPWEPQKLLEGLFTMQGPWDTLSSFPQKCLPIPSLC